MPTPALTDDTLAAAEVIDAAIERKGQHRVAVLVPARNESETIGAVVDAASATVDVGLTDQLLVVDDGSSDGTTAVARAAGAQVIRTPPRGKGQALRTAIAAADADVLVFVDADLTSFESWHIAALAGPLLDRPDIMLVKPRYHRALHGRPGEGGRVNELVARPLIRLHWPELGHISQPLAGECALRWGALDGIDIADGYAIELALLLDVADRYGASAVAEVILGERAHRNRPLHELSDQATEVLAAALDRLDRVGVRRAARVDGHR